MATKREHVNADDLRNMWLVPYHNTNVDEVVKDLPETLLQSPDWFMFYPVTLQQHNEWRESAIKALMKSFGYSRKYILRGFWNIDFDCAPMATNSEKTQLYVVGFAFTEDYRRVALIEKQHPEWQKGLLNGIGGKVEPGEHHSTAIIRKFEEETGVHIDNWEHFNTMFFKDAIVFCYKCCTDKTLLVRNVTDEVVSLFKTTEPLPKNILYNLNWLIPLALDRAQKRTATVGLDVGSITNSHIQPE